MTEAARKNLEEVVLQTPKQHPLVGTINHDSLININELDLLQGKNVVSDD